MSRRCRGSAGAFAFLADVGADSAMRVPRCMSTALFLAQTAHIRAGLQHRAQDRVIRAGPSRAERARRGADVGAIEIQPNAPAKLGDPVFSETGVGAGGARLGAIETELDATSERAVCAAARLRMAGDDGFDMHGVLHSRF